MRVSRKMWHENPRSRLKDRIVDVKEGASLANVKIKVCGGIIRLRLLTKRSSSSNFARTFLKSRPAPDESPRLILKLEDPDSCCPRHHRDSHCKNVRRSKGIWESCPDTEHARMSQCLRRLV